MDNENPLNLITIIINLAKGYLNHLSELAHLVNLETKLAIKTIINLIVLFFALLFFLFSIWTCLQVMLVIYLVSLHFSWLAALFTTTLVNIFLLIGICAYMLWIKKYLYYPATRRQISDPNRYIEENTNESSTPGN